MENDTSDMSRYYDVLELRKELTARNQQLKQEIETLRTVIASKNALIAQLRARIAELRDVRPGY